MEVRPAASVRSASSTSRSVEVSNAEVASSNSSTWGALRKALRQHERAALDLVNFVRDAKQQLWAGC